MQKKKLVKRLVILTIAISSLILITLSTSCTTTRKINNVAIEELLEITPPDPLKEDGSKLLELVENQIIMEPDYYFDLVEYIIKTEELKKVLVE